MSPIEIRALRPDEFGAAVGVLARGMRDNPAHVAVFGPDPGRRTRALAAMFAGLLRASPRLQRICATDGRTIAGFAAIAPPGTCRMGPVRKARVAARLATVAAGSLPRVVSWQSAWARHDPDAPHSHFGPIAVDADRQGSGVGTLLMGEYLARLDTAGEEAYLETDKAQNLAFYEKFGFAVTGEVSVLGGPTWFMRRPATR
jgi:GNAT superfamily N-acetyltransferase